MSSENLTPDGAIIEVLEGIAVKPTHRFYQRIDNQPWMQTSHAAPIHSTQKASWWGLRPVMVGMAAVLLLLLLIFQVPPLRLLAQQLLSRFVHQPTDTIATTELFNGNGEYIRWQWDQKSAFANAKQATGFDVAVPAVLPAGYRFEHIIYVPAEKVIFSEYIYSSLPYTDVLNDIAPEVTLSQQALAHTDQSPLLVKIGASAGVETVVINGIQGEYVQGGWTTQSSDLPTVQWNWLACCRMLRWQTEKYVFTLLTHNYPESPGFVGRDELIKIATSVAITGQ